MPDTSRIYIPKRVSGMLRGIYTSRVTVVSAPDGCGKSTLVREFTSRTRPAGISLRTITGARNTGECFAQICAIVTGQEFAEPLSEREFMAGSQEFAAARPKKPLLIIVDCDCAARTALGNYRTAKLLRDCRCARFVFVSSAMKPAYRGLAHEMGFTLIERDSLSMNISEVMEYAGRCGISFNAREAYSACRVSPYRRLTSPRPYLPPPSSGQPRSAKDARIWWVRPVSSRMRTSARPSSSPSTR